MIVNLIIYFIGLALIIPYSNWVVQYTGRPVTDQMVISMAMFSLGYWGTHILVAVFGR